MRLDFTIEPSKPHDLALVYDTWLNGFQRAPMVARYSSARYFRDMRVAVTQMMAQGRVLVARVPDWPEGMFGWACGEQLRGGFVLHAAYTKASYRKAGVAKALVQAFEPKGELWYSAGRPPFTRLLDARGFTHQPGTFPAMAKTGESA